MALVVGTNSWATVAEADTYLEDIPGTDVDWFPLVDAPVNPGEASKESWLVNAFRWLTSSTMFILSASVTSENIKNAQIQSAVYLLRYRDERAKRESMMTSGVTDFDYQEVSETLDYSQLTIPDSIAGLLTEYSTLNLIATLKGPLDE
ncbi:hypothetical protein KAR91_47435 [Candidatus Pacearchaeota archaeon]|nr:hypothetical protein [Candidatus Pacearchaeota archaeon]